MPITDPFDAVNARRRSVSGGASAYPDPGFLPTTDTGQSDMQAQVAAQSQAQQQSFDAAAQNDQAQKDRQAALDAQAAQKAQAAAAKQQDQNDEMQAKADADNNKTSGVVTTKKMVVGPGGKAYVADQPVTDPNDPTQTKKVYTPADLGTRPSQAQGAKPGDLEQGQRNPDGTTTWQNAFTPPSKGGKATYTVDPAGRIIAHAHGKGVEDQQRDVTDDPDAQNDPTVQAILAKQKTTGAHATYADASEHVRNTIGAASEQANQDFTQIREEQNKNLVDLKAATKEAMTHLGVDGTGADDAAKIAAYPAVAAINQKINDPNTGSQSRMTAAAQKRNDLNRQRLEALNDPVGYMQKMQAGSHQSPTVTTEPGAAATNDDAAAQTQGDAEAKREMQQAGIPNSGGAEPPDSGDTGLPASPQPGQNNSGTPAAPASTPAAPAPSNNNAGATPDNTSDKKKDDESESQPQAYLRQNADGSLTHVMGVVGPDGKIKVTGEVPTVSMGGVKVPKDALPAGLSMGQIETLNNARLAMAQANTPLYLTDPKTGFPLPITLGEPNQHTFLDDKPDDDSTEYLKQRWNLLHPDDPVKTAGPAWQAGGALMQPQDDPDVRPVTTLDGQHNLGIERVVGRDSKGNEQTVFEHPTPWRPGANAADIFPISLKSGPTLFGQPVLPLQGPQSPAKGILDLSDNVMKSFEAGGAEATVVPAAQMQALVTRIVNGGKGGSEFDSEAQGAALATANMQESAKNAGRLGNILTQTLPHGGGNFLGTAAMGMGNPDGMAIAMGLQGAGGNYEEAVQGGASYKQSVASAAYGGALNFLLGEAMRGEGSLNAKAVLGDNAPLFLKGMYKPTIAEASKLLAGSGAFNAATFAGAQAANNAQKKLNYDPTQSVGQGVGDAAKQGLWFASMHLPMMAKSIMAARSPIARSMFNFSNAVDDLHAKQVLGGSTLEDINNYRAAQLKASLSSIKENDALDAGGKFTATNGAIKVWKPLTQQQVDALSNTSPDSQPAFSPSAVKAAAQRVNIMQARFQDTVRAALSKTAKPTAKDAQEAQAGVASTPRDPLAQAHDDAQADADNQIARSRATTQNQIAQLPAPDPELGHLSDDDLHAEQIDVQSRVQAQTDAQANGGIPTEGEMPNHTARQGLPDATPEYLDQINAEMGRRQQLATLQQQGDAAESTITQKLASTKASTEALGASPEGRDALDRLNAYNASLDPGAPKATAQTVTLADSMSPKVGDAPVQPGTSHYLPIAHAIEQLPGDQGAFATAALKMVNGRALTDAETKFILGGDTFVDETGKKVKTEPPVSDKTGNPMVTDGQNGPVLTDDGIARIKELVPNSADVLPTSEQAQNEVVPKEEPKPAKGEPDTSVAPANPIAAHLGMEPGKIPARIAELKATAAKAQERGAKAPASVHRELASLQGALNHVHHAGAPAEPGEPVQFFHHGSNGPEVLGGKVESRAGHSYHIVGDDGLSHVVPFSHVYPREVKPSAEGSTESNPGEKQQASADAKAKETNDALAAHKAGTIDRIELNDRLRAQGMTNEDIEAAVRGRKKLKGSPTVTSEPERTPETKTESPLPGVKPEDVAKMKVAAPILSKALERWAPALKALGMDMGSLLKSYKVPGGYLGLAVDSHDLTHILLDPKALEKSMANLDPSVRDERIHKAIEEEIIHIGTRKVLGAKADAFYERLWGVEDDGRDDQRNGVLATYPYLKGADVPNSQRGEEMWRKMYQLYRDGKTTEMAALMTPEARTVFQRISDALKGYFKDLISEKNSPVLEIVKNLDGILDATEDTPENVPQDEKQSSQEPIVKETSNEKQQNVPRQTKVRIPGGGSLDATYKVLEMGDVQPHPANERDYTQPGEREKNEGMRQGFDPDYPLADSPDAVHGPAIVNERPDGSHVLLAGHRRDLLNRAAYPKYRPALEQRAPHFDPTANVKGMSQPSLYRVVKVPVDQEAEYIRRFNESPTGGIDPANDAVSASKQLTPEIIRSIGDIFQADPDKTPLAHLTDGDTKDLARQLLDAGAIRQADREKYIQPNGNLTSDGARYARSVLLGGIVSDPRLLREISDTPTASKLLNALTPLYTLKARGVDIAPLVEAVKLEADREREGSKSVEDHQAQTTLGGVVDEAPPEAKALQVMLGGISSREARRAFTQLQSLVAPLEPGQTGLFGEENRHKLAITPEEARGLVDHAKRITGAAAALDHAASVADDDLFAPKQVEPEGSPEISSVPSQLPENASVDQKAALKVYHTLAPLRADGKLSKSQAIALERAERTLGQSFIPGMDATASEKPAQPELAQGKPAAKGSDATQQSLFDTGSDVSRGQQLLFEAAAKYGEALRDAGNRTPNFSDEFRTDAGKEASPTLKNAASRTDLFGDNIVGASAPTESRAFKKWFGKSKVVDESGEPLRLFHGTTHLFDQFDPERGNIENDWGRGIYLSNTPEDVGHNYAGEGPDLTGRIERRAEQIMNEGDDSPSWGSQEHDDAMEKAREQARAELKGEHDGAIMPVYSKMENPLTLGGDGEPYWESGYNEDDETESGELPKFRDAFIRAASEYGADGQAIWGDVMDKVGYEGGRASEIIKALKESEHMLEASDNNGDLAGNEVLRRAVELMGHDGIIDKGVDSKFGSQRAMGKQMQGMHDGTVHYIAFRADQLKSATGNSGKFSAKDSRITHAGGVHDVTKTPEFKRWFGESKVTTSSGKPKIVFHQTPADFTEFDTTRGDLGAHFGTAEQAANARGGALGFYRDGSHTVAAYLKIENPLRLKDTGSFHGWAIADQLERKGILDKARAREILKTSRDGGGTVAERKVVNAEVKQAIEKAGYDGVVYSNTQEGKGDSYIAFHPEQIKSATGNRGTFDPNDDRITHAGGVDPHDYDNLISDIQKVMPARDEMESLRSSALREKPGEQQIGSPKRANYAEDNETRRSIDAVHHAYDAALKEERQSHQQWKADAEKRLRTDPVGVKKELLNKALHPDKYGTFTASDVKAAQLLVPDLMREAYRTNDPELKREAASLAYGYTMGGSETARANAARFDPFRTPAQRHREYLTKILTTPNAEQREFIAQGRTPDERATRLEAAQNERLTKIEKALADMGIKPEDIFSGEARVSLRSAKFVQEAVSKFNDPRFRKAARLFMDGASAKEVGTQTGLSRLAINDARKQFDDGLKAKLTEYAKRGFTAEDLEKVGTKDLTGILGAASAEPKHLDLSPAELEARVNAMLAKIRPDYKDADSGKLVPRQKGNKRKVDPSQLGHRLSDRPVDPYTPTKQPQFDATKPVSNLSDRPVDPYRRMMQEQFEHEKTQPLEWTKFDADNREQVIRAARLMQAADGNGFEAVHEFWQNSILSGPQTHVAISIGQGANAMHEFVFKRPIEAAINTILKDPKGVQAGELKHLYTGLMPGLVRGWQQAVRTFATENDWTRSSMMDEPMMFRPNDFQGGGHQGVIRGLKGRVIRIPCRVIMALDAFNKTLAGHMDVGAQAYRLAKARGLEGDAMAKFIESEVGTQGSQSWQTAYNTAANEVGFHAELPGVVKALSKYRNLRDGTSLINKMGRFALSMLFPFIKVPWNLMRIGLRKSPLGALNALGHVGNGLYSLAKGQAFIEGYAKTQMASDMAEQFMAWGAAALLASSVEGDKDDDDKKLLITAPRYYGVDKSGDQEALERGYGGPTMIRIGGRHGFYFNYGKFEPLAAVLGTIATGVRAFKERPGNPMPSIMSGVVGQIKGNSFLQGMSTIMDTMEAAANGRAEGLGTKWLLQFAQGFVPNIFRQPIRNWDSAVRDSRFAGPGYFLTQNPAFVPQKSDLYGNPETKTSLAPLRVLFQSGVKPTPQLEMGDKMLSNYNRGADKPYYPERPTRNEYAFKTGKKQSVPMTQSQAAAFDKLSGILFHQKLSWITPEVADNPTDNNIKHFKENLETARKEARIRIQHGQRMPTAPQPDEDNE